MLNTECNISLQGVLEIRKNDKKMMQNTIRLIFPEHYNFLKFSKFHKFTVIVNCTKLNYYSDAFEVNFV